MSIENANSFTIRIETDGQIECVHNEDTEGLLEIGKPFIFRATDVEYNNETESWDASIRGEDTVLAGFGARKDALIAETVYLSKKLGEKSIHKERFTVVNPTTEDILALAKDTYVELGVQGVLELATKLCLINYELCRVCDRILPLVEDRCLICGNKVKTI